MLQQVTQDLLEQETWELVQEGRNNLVVCTKNTSSPLCGIVVRVPKCPRNKAECDNAAQVALMREQLEYLDKVIGPAIGLDLVHRFKIIDVSAEFVARLARDVEPARSPSRKEAAFIPLSIRSLLIQQNLSLIHSADCYGPSLCIELKPKWGMMPRLEHVHPQNAIKARVCRFCMHQHLKLAQGSIAGISEYCPMDLFSGDEDRMSKSLNALFRTPQNNLRCFVQNRDLLAEGNADAAIAMVIPEVLGPGAGLADLVRALVTMLKQSQVLDRLRAVQEQGDTIDIEGTYPIWMLSRGEQPPAWTPPHLPAQDTWAEHLRLFCIAATAKDCSIIVTLRASHTYSEADTTAGANRGAGWWKREGGQCVFRVGLVDLDPKPESQIGAYHALDQEIVEKYKTSAGCGDRQCVR